MARETGRLMVLSPEEARVLACLIEKQATVPDSYPLTLNSLRLACNQSTNRDPVVAYDDRTVEAALVSLKSMGLVRFVHPSHGGRTIRYRHVADERWHLSLAELGVLAVLVLRGPQTVGEVRARSERQLSDDDADVDEILDTLAARSPEPFAVRLERRPGERDARWAHLLSGFATAQLDAASLPSDVRPSTEVESDAPTAVSPDLARDVAELWLRVERIERKLGLAEDLNAPSP
jgi:uncharacterized protein YceH (UPF0502 family)